MVCHSLIHSVNVSIGKLLGMRGIKQKSWDRLLLENNQLYGGNVSHSMPWYIPFLPLL